MEERFLERARALHRENPVADAHFDLAPEVYERRLAGEREVVGNRYLAHFKEASLNVLVSSIYISGRDLPERGLRTALGQIVALKEDLETVKEDICLVSSRQELDKALGEGKIAVLLSLEGLDPLGSDLSLLRAFYDLGVRGAGLTWSRSNAFARGCCKAGEWKEISGGLTDLGKEAVQRLEDLGMWLDVSHLNNDGFQDLLSLAGKPLIASHSNAWEVHKNYRNLTDPQIKALAKTGGVIGLNACGTIAGASPTNRKEALICLCRHAEHLAAVAGAEHIGYGFDLCNGLSAATPRLSFETEEDDLLKNHGEMELLTAALLSRGMKEEEAAGIIGGNFLRYYRSVIK